MIVTVTPTHANPSERIESESVFIPPHATMPETEYDALRREIDILKEENRKLKELVDSLLLQKNNTTFAMEIEKEETAQRALVEQTRKRKSDQAEAQIGPPTNKKKEIETPARPSKKNNNH